jgi:hypothetical protein
LQAAIDLPFLLQHTSQKMQKKKCFILMLKNLGRHLQVWQPIPESLN